jgi:hypothetical protein
VSQEAQFDERNQRRCVLCICWCSRLFLLFVGRCKCGRM